MRRSTRSARLGIRWTGALALGIALAAVGPARGAAQAAQGSVIPAPPVVPGPQAGQTHQASQDANDPTHATDAKTGDHLTWKPADKTWVDAKTGKPVPGRFAGVLDRTGAIIPQPPVETGPGPGQTHQAEQDPKDPTRATDPRTGETLRWDPVGKTWIDAKTKKPVKGRFKGTFVPAFTVEPGDSERPPVGKPGPIRVIPGPASRPKPVMPGDSELPPKIVQQEDTNFGCPRTPWPGGKLRTLGSLRQDPATRRRCDAYLAVGVDLDRNSFSDFTNRVGDQSGIGAFGGDNTVWGGGLRLDLDYRTKPYFAELGFYYTSQSFTQTFPATSSTLALSTQGTVHGMFLNLDAGYHVCHFGPHRGYGIDAFGGPTYAWDAEEIDDFLSDGSSKVNRSESGLKMNFGAALNLPLQGRFDAHVGIGTTTSFKSHDADRNLQIYLGARIVLGPDRY